MIDTTDQAGVPEQTRRIVFLLPDIDSILKAGVSMYRSQQILPCLSSVPRYTTMPGNVLYVAGHCLWVKIYLTSS